MLTEQKREMPSARLDKKNILLFRMLGPLTGKTQPTPPNIGATDDYLGHANQHSCQPKNGLWWPFAYYPRLGSSRTDVVVGQRITADVASPQAFYQGLGEIGKLWQPGPTEQS